MAAGINGRKKTMPVEYTSVTEAAQEVVGVSGEVAEFCAKQMGEMACPTCGFDWDSSMYGFFVGLGIGVALAVVLVTIVLHWKCYTMPERYGLRRRPRRVREYGDDDLSQVSDDDGARD